MMKNKLDRDEKEILEAYKNDEFVEIPEMDSKIKRHVEYAKETFRKNKRINIRISQKDLESIQRKSLEEGIPYQTLISSLIHRYISGKLVEKEKVLIKK
jgi:predicted DNA binding CopG/RHH family protein